jgi:hypothetical protein
MPFQSGDHPASWRTRSGAGSTPPFCAAPYRSADVRPLFNSTIRCWHPKLRSLVGGDWWCQWWDARLLDSARLDAFE